MEFFAFIFSGDLARLRKLWGVRYDMTWIVRANDARIITGLGTWGSGWTVRAC